MVDRVGALATITLGGLALAAELIESIESTTAFVLLIAALTGALIGFGRLALATIRFVGRINETLELIQGLPRRLDHGSRRMGRIERKLEQEFGPLPPLPSLEESDAA